MVDAIKIGKRYIGTGHPCFINAEAGANHNGDLDLAHQLVGDHEIRVKIRL